MNLIDAVQQAVITSDLNGVVTSWNRFATTMFGWTAQEAIGRDVRTLLYAPDQVHHVESAVAAISQGATVAREREVRCTSGARIWVSVTAAPIRGANGKITHIVATSSDITQQRRLEWTLT